MAWWWSWLLTAIGVTGLYLAGSKRIAGWMVGIGVQALWIAYAVTSEQWGFLVSAFAYGGVSARNLLRWRREQAADPSTRNTPRKGESQCAVPEAAQKASATAPMAASPTGAGTAPETVAATAEAAWTAGAAVAENTRPLGASTSHHREGI